MKVGLSGLTSIGFGLNDYIKMFDLSDSELKMNILDCRSGACAFAAEMAAKDNTVVATDPVYIKSSDELKALATEAKANLKEELNTYPERFAVDSKEIEHILAQHQKGIDTFLNDLDDGKQAGRYLLESLPKLTFKDEQFDLALVSHFLFTYSKELDAEFHYQAVKELLRVANEVRIFPLVTIDGELSLHVGEVVAKLQMEGLGAEIRSVPFELQKGGNAMLRVWSEACTVEKHQ